MLTLEFSVEFTPEQESVISQWMDLQKIQWNIGLSALLEFDATRRWSKLTDSDGGKGAYYPVCAIAGGDWVPASAWGYEAIPRNDGQEPLKGWTARACPLYKVGAGDRWLSGDCTIPEIGAMVPNVEPLLLSIKDAKSPGGLSIMARADNIPNDLAETPSLFRHGTLALLFASWDRHKSDPLNTGQPKRKRYQDKWDVLYTGNAKELSKTSDAVRIPKIGWVGIPKLSDRWRDSEGNAPDICSFKIVRRDRRFRVQLTGDLKRSYKAQPSNLSVGVDLGFVYAHIESNGNRSALLDLSLEKLEQRKQRLQAKLDSKLDQRLVLWLRNPETTHASLIVRRKTRRGIEEEKPMIRISLENWEKLKQCRTAGEAAQVIGQKRDKRYQALRHALPKSAKEQALRVQIASIDRKIAATRKTRDAKLATRLAKKYGHIAIENGLQREVKRYRPDPKKQGDKYLKNGAERQSETNKQLKALAPGRKIAMLEAMSKRYGRDFSKQESPTTTTECPCCGRHNEPSLKMDEHGDRRYSCACGWEIDQDVNAATNIELRSSALKPEVQLSQSAETARIRSYQLEADGKLFAEPQWRMPPAPPKAKKESRGKRRKALRDSEPLKEPKGQRLTAASRKNQVKALESGVSKMLP